MQVIDSKLLDSRGQIKDDILISELKEFYHSDKFHLIVSAFELLKSKSAASVRHPTGISSFLYAIEMRGKIPTYQPQYFLIVFLINIYICY